MRLKRPRRFAEEYYGYFYKPPNELFEAIGRVAVESASVDETLYLLYWYYLDVLIDVAPIITRDMKPNRIADDIIKVAVASGEEEEKIKDLRDVIADYRELAEKRNKCMHWFWYQRKNRRHKKHTLMPPAYRTAPPETFAIDDINNLAFDLAWVERRLYVHGMPEEEYMELRRQLGYWIRYIWPAPWRGKPPQRAPRPLHPRVNRNHRRRDLGRQNSSA